MKNEKNISKPYMTHKSDIENNISKPVNAYNSSVKEWYCPKCGAGNIGNTSFCSKCGIILTPEYKPEKEIDYDNLERLYIGKNSGYYMKKFEKIRNSEHKMSWNNEIFVFPYFWFISRRLHEYAFLYFAVVIFILKCSYFNFFIALGLEIMFRFAVIFYSNYLYMRRIEKLTEQGKKLSGEELRIHIEKNGGYSPSAVIVAFISYIIFVVIAAFI